MQGWVVVMILTVSGCTHVQLAPAPPATASVADRLDAFDRLKPTSMTITTTTRDHVMVAVDSSLVLADGTEVSMPEDLLIVLPAESSSARAARTAARARTWKWVGYGFMVASLFGGLALRDNDPDADNRFAHGVMFGGVALGAVVALVFRNREIDARHEAYAEYPRGLLQQLQLCATGLDIHECK